LGHVSFDPVQATRVLEQLMVRLKVLDTHLKANNYFVGTNVTIADVVAFSNIFGSVSFFLGETQRK
jgi:glutathione S-transferase